MDNTDPNRWLAVIGVDDPQNRFSNVSSSNDWQAFARPLHASVRQAEGRIAAWRRRAQRRWAALRASFHQIWEENVDLIVGRARENLRSFGSQRTIGTRRGKQKRELRLVDEPIEYGRPLRQRRDYDGTAITRLLREQFRSTACTLRLMTAVRDSMALIAGRCWTYVRLLKKKKPRRWAKHQSQWMQMQMLGVLRLQEQQLQSGLHGLQHSLGG